MESSSGGSGKSSSSLSRKFTGATVSSRKGVQKFYTKIRHKIEDSMPPKISAKLNKNNVTASSSTTTASTSTSTTIMTAKSHSSTEHSLKPTPPPRVSAANKKRKPLINGGMENKSIVNTIKLSPKSSPSYENVKISNNPNGLGDSDEESRTSLNDSTLSLEDEIFEELEKVAHDEAKLNAVLKNFDKILADFSGPINVTMTTSTPTLKLCNNSSNQINGTPTVTGSKKTDTKSEGKAPTSHKPLQKSKTCSIIESRCILKKSISDSAQNDKQSTESISISNELQHFAALQVTKSLWNLQDFEAFAKSGKQFDKFDCRLPVLKSSSSSSNFKLGKSLSSPETPSNVDKSKSMKQINKVISIDNSNRVRSHLPRATSVWEVSSSTSLTNLHPLCTRTSSGSKIPVKKITPQRLAYSGRSNSFCDQSPNIIKLTTSPSPSSSIISSSKANITATSISPQKIIQVGKVLPTPKRSPGKITTVNKIVKNLNELSRSGSGSDINRTDIVKRPGSTNSLVSPISSATVRSTTAATTNLANKKYNRLINTASSTPHSLNKIGISVKASSSTVTLSSAATTPASSSSLTTTTISPKSTKQYLKSANSELSLNTLKSVKTLSGGSNKIHNLTATAKKTQTQQSDFLLNKCLEKGQEILRKVEAFGSVTKLERGNEYSKSGNQLQQSTAMQVQQQQQAQQQQRSKETKISISTGQHKTTTVIKSTSSSTVTISTGQNQQCDDSKNKFIPANKKDNHKSLSSPALENNAINSTNVSSNDDTVDGCSLPIGKLQKTLPQICYAKECTIQFPRLESCKIIPPLLCHPSQQHAELLVNVKTTQQPLRVHQDSMLCINSDIIRSEKDYHSDCSEDSGHISNENDDLGTPILTDNDGRVSKNSTSINKTNFTTPNCNGDVFLKSQQKGVKISELLEKFESAVTKDASSSSSSSSTIQELSASLSSSSSSSHQGDNNNCIKKKCTTIKVAEVKPVKCITSSMEIYPTYSSEVIIQIQ